MPISLKRMNEHILFFRSILETISSTNIRSYRNITSSFLYVTGSKVIVEVGEYQGASDSKQNK